ncbi:hypothetical protein L7F22_003225 [Adiantum nelumboides]|nr:hypothetical protein [Adiantum nelumboides]
MHVYRSTALQRASWSVANSKHTSSSVASTSYLLQRRNYAVPVNKQSSVDPLLGIAPPPAPKPIEEENGEKDALPNFMVGTARANNPNDLSELLKGNRINGSHRGQAGAAANSQTRNRLAAALGAMRRGAGSAIPTHDLENAFIPPEDPKVQSTSTQKPEQRIEVDVNETKEPVDREHPHAIDAIYGRNDLDERILAAARALHHAKQQSPNGGLNASSLPTLLQSFKEKSERTLSVELPNENRPKDDRRVRLTSALSDDNELSEKVEDGVLLIAYVTGLDAGRGQERISVCSGFAVEGGDRLREGESGGKGALVVSCAHTLRGSLSRSTNKDEAKEGEGSLLNTSSIALAVTRTGHVFPIAELLSSLPSSDLVLLQLGEQAIAVEENLDFGVPLRPSNVKVRTLPISPYPANVGAELCVSSFWGWEDDAGSTLPAFEFSQPSSTEIVGSDGLQSALTISPGPLPPPVGREKDTVKRERDDAGRSRWGRARLVEYRDESGKEARTGTYDDLAQLDFKLMADNVHNPPALQEKAQTLSFPPPGSSGGPIVDSQTGAVVGITRGVKMGVLEGRRGDGIPAERLFFMFALPGFGSKKNE